MRKTRKILIFISVLIAGLVSALGIYSALDADFIYNFGSKVNDAKLFSGIRMALLFGSLLFLVIVISILFTFRKRKKAVEAIRITNAGGTLSISSQTIERLAELVAKSTEGIFDIRTTVSIPEVSVRLQESIRNKIMDTTGTDIENIRILIDGIVDSEK
jgi:hypothetical protein